jgi:hypothetical protein
VVTGGAGSATEAAAGVVVVVAAVAEGAAEDVSAGLGAYFEEYIINYNVSEFLKSVKIRVNGYMGDLELASRSAFKLSTQRHDVCWWWSLL